MASNEVQRARARKRKEQQRNQQILIVTTVILVIALALIFTKGGSNLFSPAVTIGESFPQIDPSQVVTTASGLQYQDVVVGRGAAAQAFQTVVVDYAGWLTDGTKFDASTDRGEPFEFLLGAGEVIPGWDEGVAGMKVGGTRILIVPADLAYRDTGAGFIPAGATLVFEVQLIEVR